MTSKKSPKKRATPPKCDTLEQIKRLLVLALMNQGVQSKDIAAALGVDPAIVTRMIPVRKMKKK